MTSELPSCDIEIRVRYAEVDSMGVLHHSRYWVYFETGRTELMRSRGVSYRDVEAGGVFLVVARCSARFHAPARYDEVLVLTTRLERIGQARLDHTYELKRKCDGLLICTAQTTLACVDSDGKIIPIPNSVRRCS